ncbi:zinc ribbon domain-containing protein [Aquisalimonas sp.]|uniref:FmdB family zinc ribbon protein n=1 Tax=unclassified Aquisalimonas TaxID=2644645 RepID=UPI0025BB8B18|nr:zinc ribbon domain-containing protein [Aquisalimonas sp.]
MPIYEYLCDGCGHEQEAIQKFSDAPLTDCDECGEPRLRKKISAAGFRLKGGGWYETDFKSSNQRNVAGDSTSGGSSGGGGDSGGSSSGGSEGSKSGSTDSKAAANS